MTILNGRAISNQQSVKKKVRRMDRLIEQLFVSLQQESPTKQDTVLDGACEDRFLLSGIALLA